MLTLSSFSFSSVVWGDVIVSPRAERIVLPPNHCISVEILCSIKNESYPIAACSFFQSLTACEHIKLFQLILNSVFIDPLCEKFTISINTPIQIIQNIDEFIPQLLNNRNQKIAFELSEKDIQSIGSYECGILDKIEKIPNVSLWLDDFGNNQSNFDVILSNNIHFNTIKVSKELFWGLLKSDMNFLRSLLAYLSKGYNVIVEGIETQSQFEFISNIKDIKIQGYYFNPQLESINE